MRKILMTATMIMGGMLLAATVADASQEVYRWVDKEGVVHYGDRAPEGVKATPVTVKPNTVQSVPSKKHVTPTTAPVAAPDANAAPELSIAEQKRQARAAKRAEFAEKARQTESQCAIMRNQKAFVEPSPRVLVKDDDGTTRRLTDSERASMLNEANAYLNANCQ